jgi:16S rRNA (guanine966-N2)-methyltransferase
MTRVIAGAAGGRRLAVPAGRDTRPTSDRAREGLFGTIVSIAGPLTGKRVLDLYAGSGAVGLEALSRGAGHVLLVESGRPAVTVIEANIEAIGLSGAVLAADKAERVLARGPAGHDTAGHDTAGPGGRDAARYDIVFADPPYAVPDAEVTSVLTSLIGHGWLDAGALVVVERASRSAQLNWPAGYRPIRARRYGEATFWYGLAPEAGALDDE